MFIFTTLLILISVAVCAAIVNLNSSGTRFPQTVYTKASFVYRYVSVDTMAYYSIGSGGGVCNILGYWQISNKPTAGAIPASTITADTALCSAISNGISAPMSFRTPLVDFSTSDDIPAYLFQYYPDLQMLPALAGAVVPLYNIPELSGLATPLVLSRATLAGIFMGSIQYWNDSRVLADNPAAVRLRLSGVSSPIRVVARQDSTGSNFIFSHALSLFSSAFSKLVGGSPTPQWCGPLTDEMQLITVAGCQQAAANGNDKHIVLSVLNPRTWGFKLVKFQCDDSLSMIQEQFMASGHGTSVFVVKKTIISSNKYSLLIAFNDTKLAGVNWYTPAVVVSGSATAGSVGTVSGGSAATSDSLGVGIAAFQEGGFANSNFISVPQLLWTQSVFVMGDVQLVNTRRGRLLATLCCDTSI